MNDDEARRRPTSHEVGMMLDAISEEELAERIALLEAEIGRLKAAIAARRKSSAAAESVFRF
jgi:uncharacterized small protein (DUF1192 family)